MKRILLPGLLSLFILSSLSAQDSTFVQPQPQKQKQQMGQRVYFGGNVFFTVGSYTRIGINPLIGYKLTPKLSVGVKVAYEYVRDNRYVDTYETNNYGWSVFARYRVIPALYFHTEYAMINYDLYNALGESSRDWVPFWYVGGGYSQRIGPNVWANAQVLFDVLQNEKSPYRSWEPFFSVGVGVGF